MANRSITYKSYWAQRKAFAQMNGILERAWESADGRSQVAQIVLPRSRITDVLIELQGGSQEAIWMLGKHCIRFGNGMTGSRQEAMLRNDASIVTFVPQAAALGTRSRATCNSAIFGAPSGNGKPTIDRAESWWICPKSTIMPNTCE
jgi:hypothetical protein